MAGPPSWSRGREQGRSVVVGRICGDQIELLRVEPAASGPAHLRLLAAEVIPWGSGESLGEPLERLLKWRADEPVVLVSKTPALAGETISLEGPPGQPSGAPSAGGDERDRLFRSRWEVNERALEAAARFFDCTLESVSILVEEIHPAAPAATVVAGLTDDLPLPVPPPDIPHVHVVLLPLLLGKLMKSEAENAGLLLVEETQLSYGVWSGGLPLVLRSLPLGSLYLVDCVVEALRCSPREARTLLTRIEEGNASERTMRVLARILKALLPLYTGAFGIFGAELSPRTSPPARLFVGGLWPTVFVKMFCHAPFVSRCTQKKALPRVLLRPEVLDDRGSRGTQPPDSSSLRMLETLAVAVLLSLPAEVTEGSGTAQLASNARS